MVDTQRWALSTLALMPGFALMALPPPVVSLATGSVGMVGLLGTSALVSVLAVHMSGWRRAGIVTRRRDPSTNTAIGALLLPRAHRNPPADFPDLRRQRAHVLQRLDHRARPDPKPYGAAEPDRIDFALAAMIGHVVDLWQVARPDDLSDTQIRELYMLDRLARAAPDTAGRLAQSFRNPSLAIDTRDKIAALRAQRARFELNRDAFEATRALADRRDPPGDLFAALDALGVPDPDLWHRVVTEYDPNDIAQRDAALACACEPDCNRATVALWFFDLVMDGSLETAARDGDEAFLDGVREVIAQWNADRYLRDEIGLDSADALTGGAMAVARRLDRVAELAGTPRWDMPVAMFETYPGRAPRPRPAWDIRTGRVVARPLLQDYLGTA
ncbi:hypothetical protein SAMN05421759_104240 [Roseivivax lentus]|uniref:DUF4274 domain-containing protein n=1 Tax=Roseivivax lentus TaxID=633194 RepID=A0A1N7ME39_9RHOB|nr:hypothetical protein [Roseivivax lentus]SIS84363.1 hypothetical protein SAMN05421759_104240 [Roseivivax lentus]